MNDENEKKLMKWITNGEPKAVPAEIYMMGYLRHLERENSWWRRFNKFLKKISKRKVK